MAQRRVDYLKVFVHAAAVAPLLLIIRDWFSGDLGFNPIRDITFRTGRDALTLLILALACSPAARLLGLKGALRVRRALGVYAFVYAAAHFFIFVGLDYAFDLDLIVEGIFEKPFALVGFATFIILLPLAVTSTNGMRRRLGRTWKRLHYGIYIAAPLAVVHFLWAAKQDYAEPAVYGTIVALLLATRLPFLKARPKTPEPVQTRRRGPKPQMQGGQKPR